jgi:hypothetical protein
LAPLTEIAAGCFAAALPGIQFHPKLLCALEAHEGGTISRRTSMKPHLL